MAMRRLLGLTILASIAMASTAWGATLHVTMRAATVNGEGSIIGLIVFQDTAKGLKIMPNLRGLTEGQHGMHVHENPSCGAADKDGKTVPGLAAGSHFDPDGTGRHEGPAGGGHLGDLPILYVDAAGRAARSSWAPRLEAADLLGRAIVIHAGGDNYSDSPAKLGGGGARAACGVVVH
jgi:Cu-Zn family superoxide dismutase